MALKEFQKAIDDLTRATEIKQDFAEAHFFIAKSHIELEHYINALNEYTIAIQQRPGYAEAYQARAAVKQSLGDSLGSSDDQARSRAR